MIIKFAVHCLVGIATLGLLFAGGALLYLKQSGARALSVQSGSMAPAIQKGDLVVVKASPTYKVGDVITFVSPKNENVTITHRIVVVDEKRRSVQTKGDANRGADQAVSMRLIVGKVEQTLPKAGYAIDFVRKPIGLLAVVYVPALLIIGAELKHLTAYYTAHRSYLVLGRRPYRQQLRTRQPLTAKLAAGFLLGGMSLGVALPAHAALFSVSQVTGNTISSVLVRDSYQVCNFPATATLLSYALIDVLHPELPDPPLLLNEPIIPGTYKITAVSHDEHIDHPNAPSQPNERWFVQLYGDKRPDPVHATGVTDDIPDDMDQTVTVVDQAATITETVTGVRYVHNAFLTGLEKEQFGNRKFDELSEEEKRQVLWNSVHPGCLTFERLPFASATKPENPNIIQPSV